MSTASGANPPAAGQAPDLAPFFEASWVAAVRGAADRLDGELGRAPVGNSPADHRIASAAIGRARALAERRYLPLNGGDTWRARWIGRPWRLAGAWWTGSDVDQAWAALHTAGQALLCVEDVGVVRSQLGDIHAAMLTALGPTDSRVKGYVDTLERLAPAGGPITPADRSQLRAIRAVCDDTADHGHADARTYRNTLIQLGSLLAVVLAVVAVLGWGDKDFRAVFSGTKTVQGPWYVLELELIASLAGLTGAVLSLGNYSGFQFTYGLPFVQALLKGTTGAATGLFGVLLVQSGIISSLKQQTGAAIIATAVIFGYAQYLFTRLVDQQAKSLLTSAGSRNDPAITPQVPPGAKPPNLSTTAVPKGRP
jgi:hypothetical protein